MHFVWIGFRIGKSAVLDALRASLTRMGVASMDLYIVHFPFPLYIGGMQSIVDGFAEAYDLGLIKTVGVSNFNRPDELRKVSYSKALYNVHALFGMYSASPGIHLSH